MGVSTTLSVFLSVVFSTLICTVTVERNPSCNTFLILIGVLLMAASETEDNDILWCINHDSFPFKKPLMETQVCTYEAKCHS